MNNSSNKDQHYALDSSGNIRHIKDANPSNDEFFCLFCHPLFLSRAESDYTTVPTDANECQSPETGGGMSSACPRRGTGWHRLALICNAIRRFREGLGKPFFASSTKFESL